MRLEHETPSICVACSFNPMYISTIPMLRDVDFIDIIKFCVLAARISFRSHFVIQLNEHDNKRNK